MTSGFTLAQDVARNTKIEYYGTSIGYSVISKKILREKYESEALKLDK